MQQAQNKRFRIGFTGSRKGMTEDRQEAVRLPLSELIEEHPNDELQAHHGDAIGADAQFHAACQQLKLPVVIHPRTRFRSPTQAASCTVCAVPSSDYPERITTRSTYRRPVLLRLKTRTVS